MRIEKYFAKLEQSVTNCALARSFNISYDNTGHHKKLNLPTYPHHKHDGSEENVIASQAPDLTSVIEEIVNMLQVP